MSAKVIQIAFQGRDGLPLKHPNASQSSHHCSYQKLFHNLFLIRETNLPKGYKYLCLNTNRFLVGGLAFGFASFGGDGLKEGFQ